MANPTTNYGFVMPTPTDLVTDLPADFGVFGQAVDTQMKTNADAATQKATLTTKGDIYAASGTSTPARLAVGANDTVLTADSSTATGLKWATASGGINAVYLSKPTSGSLYYTSSRLSSTLSTTNSNNFADVSDVRFVPIWIGSITASRIGIRTSSAFTGVGVTMRLGIYNNDPTLNIPTTVLLDAGQVTPTAVNTNYEITISQVLTPGLYWLAAKTNAYTSGTNSYRGSAGNLGGFGPLGFSANSLVSAISNTTIVGYAETQAAGVLATANAATLNVATGDQINIAIGY